MRDAGRISTMLAAMLAAQVAAGAAVAQPHRPIAARPDFTGLWSNASLTGQERPDDLKALVIPEAQALAYEKKHRGKPPDVPPGEDDVGGVQSEWWETDVGLARIRGQARTSWIVSPADGQRPFKPAVKAANKANHERLKTDFANPETRMGSEQCLADDGAGPPLDNGGYNDNYQFVQTRDRLAIWAEWMHSVRVIRLDGSGHPPSAVRLPMGDSVGRWEGQTLVVETTNFLPREVNAPDKDPAADMKVVERFTRLPSGEVLYAYAVTNPARYTQTWQAEELLRPAKGPIYEFACHEGNYALVDMLAGARRLEGKTVDGVAAGR
jgi:hypothetical protein